MRRISVLLLLLSGFSLSSLSQVYPTFGPEINVIINGIPHDAMEPFISTDGNTIYFNSLNAADTTNLYSAIRVDDSTFTYQGVVGGTYDTSADHLDAVASMDTSNNFFWTSLRDFPMQYETLSRGVMVNDSITNRTKVYGDFNIYIPGWLVFDAAVSYQGDLLYYSNAFFDSCTFGIPCIARLGVAQKVNDSTFMKLPNTDLIFANINDTNYIQYAPQVTQDGLELYYTRLEKGTTSTELCVSVRDTPNDVFSLPMVFYSNPGRTPEATTPTSDKQKIYYHQRNGFGVFELYLRYRTGTTDLAEIENDNQLVIYPNPTRAIFTIKPPISEESFKIEIFSSIGKRVLAVSNESTVDIGHLSDGLYIVKLLQGGSIYSSTIQKQ